MQHSVMARAAFKRVERSTYVLATAGVLALMFWQWRPIPAVLRRVDDTAARTALWAPFAAGWTRSPAFTDQCAR